MAYHGVLPALPVTRPRTPREGAQPDVHVARDPSAATNLCLGARPLCGNAVSRAWSSPITQISVSELARCAGVSPATIYRIEHHKTIPRPYIARRLAAALGSERDVIAEFASVAARTRLGPPRREVALSHDVPGRRVDEREVANGLGVAADVTEEGEERDVVEEDPGDLTEEF